MSEHKVFVEGSFAILAIGSLAAVFPPLAGLMSFIYYALKAWETDTVQRVRRAVQAWLLRP